MKKLIFFIFFTILTLSCGKDDFSSPKMSSIPIRIGTTITKVSYDTQTGYALKSGETLKISSDVRTDVSAVLSYNENDAVWYGNLWYAEILGVPSVGTQMTATLIHDGNSDVTTYAHGVRNTHKELVELNSLMTGAFEFGDNTITLHQKATFLETTITFNFVGTGTMPLGETSVDVVCNGENIVSGIATIRNVAELGDPARYQAHFFIALPGGITFTSDDYLEICDRKVQLPAATLESNTRYGFPRTVLFRPELGDPYWSDGSYGRVSHENGAEVTGIIVFVNNYEDNDTSNLALEARALTENDYGYGHALVMSLRNAASSVRWGSKTAFTPFVTTPAATLNISNVSGYHNTDLQRGNISPDYALNYRNESGDNHTHDSGWFLPSIGQWMYSISTRGFGDADPAEDWIVADTANKKWLTNGSIGNLILVKKGNTDENILVLSLNARLEVLKNHFGCDYDSFGMTIGTEYGDNYWTSTEFSANEVIRMNLGSMKKPTGSSDWYSTIKVQNVDKSKTWVFKEGFIMKVRPFLAF